jgi:hypothetical protein
LEQSNIQNNKHEEIKEIDDFNSLDDSDSLAEEDQASF